MHIYSLQTFAGRNIYSHRPVIKMVLDIGNLANITSKDADGFNQALLDLFPGLRKHCCSLGYEGGFVERLTEGTYFGHIIEHLAIELQSEAGYPVNYGKTRLVSEPSIYYIVFEYKNEKCAAECARWAVDIVEGILSGNTLNKENIIRLIRKTAVESDLGPSAKAIFDEAVRRGIPVARVGNESLIRIGCGKYSRLVQASLTDRSSCIAVDIAGNKHLTKQILMDSNIPVPYGDIAYTEESALALAERLGFPVVVKPYDGNQGKGVMLNIQNSSEVLVACGEAFKISKAVIIEKYIKGCDYRLLVVGGEISAAAERRPPMVAGDGIHTVRELVDTENGSMLRGDDHEKPLTRIKLDTAALQHLSRKGLNADYVPKCGETVTLRDNCNLSTGGTARECVGEVHPRNAELAIKAVKLIGLDIAGVDITAENISKPIEDGSGAILEINAAPGLRMHIYPTQGLSRNVAADILDMLYPEGSEYSVPIVSITGTNGKTTTTRIIKHTLDLTGKKVGMTSTSGVFIGDECILKGDNTGPISAKTVLSNRTVEAAVLETARGGLVRKGLGYDLADVGVIVNVTEDHFGLDSVESLEDLAFVKSLVVEAVKPQGFAVLNADDKMTGYILERAKSRVMLFSGQRTNVLMQDHIRNGGRAAYANKGSIYLFDGRRHVKIADFNNIPLTMGGIIECNIENSLAALCALYCLNVPLDTIRLGLMSFKPDVTTNPGRFNLFEMGDFKVMLDYGHNPAGYSAVISFIEKMNAARLVGIIGMPGDRPDRSMANVGQMCGSCFSKIYIKEDEDLRGRRPGEVAAIFYKALCESGMKKENITVINSEIKALEAAILDAQPGDLIVMFYEKFEPALELINGFKNELDSNTVRTVIAVGQETM